MIDIELNGELRTVATWTTLQQLVDTLDMHEKAVALAVNRNVIPRQMWPQHVLLAQDKIDIVRAIGGG
ncbi:sulfur carrier protein ThiS [Massilia sp. CF038]|uniref:sulfur carrier protein ThiS n=1 Tax=Massilia sp. CF038 TaxID=1881045 RepID=UPI000917A4CF|nr:sulfur carrier protein ThiS [Massilia sp. CF038]SHH28034.1 sulfur carrier protein ThiS [Massilia sp. CF038]